MKRFVTQLNIWMFIGFLLIQNHSYAAFLNVISPKENQVFINGGTLNITYASFDVDTVKIEVFSPVNGGIWETIADSFLTSNGTTIPITNINAPDWAHYKIRITDFSGLADTAYSGYFTILNPSSPTIKLNIKENAVTVGTPLTFEWDASPSVDSLVIQVHKPNRNDWEFINVNYATKDSALSYVIEPNAPGGMYYFRSFYHSTPNKISNIDSVFVTDNFFSGIDSLSPGNGDTAVSIYLNQGASKGKIFVFFNEAVRLVSGKIIDIYNETGGLVNSFPTDSNRIYLLPDQNNDSSILVIEPRVPLLHSSHYYLLMDVGTVKDLAGNNFEGIQSPTNWTFNTVKMHTFSGSVSYEGTINNSVVISLFNQNAIATNNFSNPANIISHFKPSVPYNYSIGVPQDGYYGLLCYIDVNENYTYDSDEPVAFRDNILMDGKDSSGINLQLKNLVQPKPTFVLDTKKSYWGSNKPFKYNKFINGFTAGNQLSGNSPITFNPALKSPLLWELRFMDYGTNAFDLSATPFTIGTKLHLEYTYPDSIHINSIVAGAKLTGLQFLPKRLIIDLEVVDPVESQNSNLGAACGLLISCSPNHTNRVKAFGSSFYGDFDIATMAYANYIKKDVIGVSIVGKNSVEGMLTALLSDSFLINMSDQFNPLAMPENSLQLRGLIPEILPNKYIVDNSANVITTAYDSDGNGMPNKMYAVSITNAIWSSRRLLFGADNTTSVQNAENSVNVLYYNRLTQSIESSVLIRSLKVFDLAGRIVFESDASTKSVALNNSVPKGIYIIQFESQGRIRAQKLMIQ